jgi:predicted nucleic acid-binding protein
LAKTLAIAPRFTPEEYALKTAICVADALVAATAAESQLTLCTANWKHYRPIGELEINLFQP